ncbi:hypothetical protein COLO4_12590 [Corchorus olitorius]|uniref:Uncharacterized protein n=1 Tax=Corchorus olitorius TaxID=93759 RepID=A0A1R3K0P2_9ROSI|nr:hypothetical protein COLO4_12590 [Corchorus olitorius]
MMFDDDEVGRLLPEEETTTLNSDYAERHAPKTISMPFCIRGFSMIKKAE